MSFVFVFHPAFPSFFPFLLPSLLSFLPSLRLSTIQDADKIVVLDQGRVAEEGSHRALLEGGGGRYAEMWDMQQKHHAMLDGEEGEAEEARRLKRKAAYDLRMQNSGMK